MRGILDYNRGNIIFFIGLDYFFCLAACQQRPISQYVAQCLSREQK